MIRNPKSMDRNVQAKLVQSNTVRWGRPSTVHTTNISKGQQKSHSPHTAAAVCTPSTSIHTPPQSRVNVKVFVTKDMLTQVMTVL
mmetsp:Transcript_40735/g.41595  ORF Transcript_40735/g.41595 Transcript_40735/m.41595 type:complete len:85 (-) Transcript_40735:305-559(-)